MTGLRATPALATFGLGAGLLLLAALLDAEPLYVPGFAFALIALLAGLLVLGGGTGVHVERHVERRRVLEEEPVRIALAVRSARPLPTGALLDDLLRAPAPLAAGRRRTDVTLVARFGRRGRKVLPAPRVALRDPLGLVTRTVTADVAAAEVLVLPRLLPVTAPEGAGDEQAGGRRGRPAVAAEVELDGVRQARTGTPASRIFWPSLARGGELLERRLTADGDSRPLVVLDPRGAATAEDEDAAVRAAASLAVHLARRGGCAVLVPGDRRPTALEPTLAAWPHLHARLALVTGDHAPALAALGTRRGDLLYVAARRLTRPPRALAQAPGGGRLLVVPGEVPGRRAAFAVAGCHGYELSGRPRVARAA